MLNVVAPEALLGQAPVMTTNIRLGWNGLAVTNALPYSNPAISNLV
jgi:hypothetical protein